jgi:hypothetical protein
MPNWVNVYFFALLSRKLGVVNPFFVVVDLLPYTFIFGKRL